MKTLKFRMPVLMIAMLFVCASPVSVQAEGWFDFMKKSKASGDDDAKGGVYIQNKSSKGGGGKTIPFTTKNSGVKRTGEEVSSEELIEYATADQMIQNHEFSARLRGVTEEIAEKKAEFALRLIQQNQAQMHNQRAALKETSEQKSTKQPTERKTPSNYIYNKSKSATGSGQSEERKKNAPIRLFDQ